MTRDDISDYVGANLVDPLSRVPGVGTVQLFGSPYAMRIWLDPNKLETYGLAVGDIITAVRAQNAQVTIGQLGGAPSVEGQQLNATISAQERLQTPEQFRDIVLRSNPDGSALKLGDVARVEIGAETYEFVSRYNRQPASGVAISLATGANALETAAGVERALDALRPYFPAGLEAVVPFDTTPFVRMSIKGVITTLVEAIVLVFLVIYLFLQNFRATLIPTIAVPVVLLGTMGVLAALGFSINMLTMFAHGAGDRPAGGRRHRRGRERRTRDARGGAVARRSHAQVHAGDHRRARRYRPGARGGVRADGVHAGFDRRDLPAVLRDDRVGHVVVGAGRDRAHAGAVRDDAEAGAQGRAPRRDGLLRVVQPRVRARQRELPGRRARHPGAQRPLHARVRRTGRPDGPAVRAAAQRVPAAGGPGNPARAADRAGRRDTAAHAAVAGKGGAAFPRGREERGQGGVRRAGLQLRRHWPEQRHGLDQPEGLERAQGA